MAGEIVKTEAIVLDVRPWSRTSHVLRLISPHGVLSVLAKGAERPKSAFLGQYDMHYTCEVLYYARGDLHPLREVSPLSMRERLRRRWRENLLAGYSAWLCETLAPELSPGNPEAELWYRHHKSVLDDLASGCRPLTDASGCLEKVLELDLAALSLSGLRPDLPPPPPPGQYVEYCLSPERTLRVSHETLSLLHAKLRGQSPAQQWPQSTLLAALRWTWLFASWHLPLNAAPRRALIARFARKLPDFTGFTES